MAASVNNMAATFATVPMLSSSSSSASSSSSSINKQASFALSISPKTISTSWNPHTALPRSLKSSLLNLYGLPGPPPVHHRRRQHRRQPISFSSVGVKLPNVILSYLNRNATVQTVSLSSLSKGKRLVLVGVPAAFSPSSTRLVKRVEAMKSKAADLIACVAANDVFVMKAWAENLGVGEKVMMLSDGRGELSRAIGASVDAKCERSMKFCLSASNGVVTTVDFDDEDD